MTPRKPIDHGDPVAPISEPVSTGIQELDLLYMFCAISAPLHARRQNETFVESDLRAFALRNKAAARELLKVIHEPE
jgi:hypothetical protein